MKKIAIIFSFVIVCMGVFLFRDFKHANAESARTSIHIDSAITITEDTTYTNVDFTVNIEERPSSVFIIENGANLILNDCTITTTSSYANTYIFVVNSGTKLSLDNVDLLESKYSQAAISNSGKVEINNVKFWADKNAIINGSTETDSFIIHNHKANNEKITLNSGYITITKDSVITKGDASQKIKMTLATSSELTPVVKSQGENVFANRYIDVFSWTGTGKFLDYIGDGANISGLNAGDIVVANEIDEEDFDVTSFASSNKIDYPEMNFSANRFLNEGYVFRNLEAGYIFDNYSATTQELSLSKVSSATNQYVTAKVSVLLQGSDTPVSTSTEYFLVGSRHAIFVDIPSDKELKEVKFYVGQEENNSILSVSGLNFTNGTYMRPILNYISQTYSSCEVDVNFVFKDIEKPAIVSVLSDNDVEVSYPSGMIAGNEYTFTIPITNTAWISNVYFNSEDITSALVKGENSYTFTAICDENNTIVVESIALPLQINIKPEPEKTEFVYGEEIVLTQDYVVPETGETITINYVRDDCLDVGTYDITEHTFSSSIYNVNIIDGQDAYTIIQQEVDVEEVVKTQKVVVEYAENLNFTKEMFITSSIPNYLTLTLDSIDIQDIQIGQEQTFHISAELKNSNYKFKNDKDSVSVVLVVEPTTLNVDNCVLEDYTTTYVKDNQVKILVTGYDESKIGIDYVYFRVVDENTKEQLTTQYAVNSGKYIVEATLYSISNFYKLPQKEPLTAEITINKASLMTEMNAYAQSVSSYTFIYDGQIHKVDTKASSLPSGVQIIRVDNDADFVNVGAYETTIHFDYDKNNYIGLDSCDVITTINPKPVTISLLNNTFNYTGSVPSLVTVVKGVVAGDSCEANLASHTNINKGTYYIAVESLTNSNYTFTPGIELMYEIKSITVDLSGINYENVSAEYDGRSHRPVLSGTLPEGVTYIIDDIPCKDAGTYKVKCSFVSNNINYKAPEPIYATVNIAKRPIYVIFSEPSNMMANGIIKKIGVTFTGNVDGEVVAYEENYSEEPITAGDYNLTVTLPTKTNYYIVNNNVYTFTIFMSTISVNEAGITVQVDGKFANNNALEVSRIESVFVDDALKSEKIKKYVTLNFTYSNYSTEAVQVKVKAKDVVSNTKNLQLYRLEGDTLKEIDFEVNGDVISFALNSNSDIVFVEKHSMAYVYRPAIIIVYILTALTLIGYFAIIFVYTRRSNPYKELLNKTK